VAVLATVWTVFDRLAWSEMRAYDPRIAWRTFTATELLRSPAAHASLLLGSSHFVLRHRAAIRDSLIGAVLPGTGRDAIFDPDAAGPRRRRAALAAATREDFRCPAVGTRALAALLQRLAEEGVPTLVVATPGNSEWDRDPEVLARLDACLAAAAAGTGAGLVSRADLPAFSPADFRDQTHLRSPARFTKALGPHLARALAPPSPHALR
jgi:hypothetical protein